mgnify:CR=1 FL=1
MNAATEYDAVVFDNDGVLVELTEMDLLRRAARRAFADHGVADPPEAFVDHAANGDLEALSAVEESLNISLAEYWASREDHAATHQCEAVETGEKPLYEDVAELRRLDATLAVVSNNQHDTVAFIVDHHGLDDLFEHVAGRQPTVDGARRRKPEPHYLDRALDELGTTDALYVGDSPKDIVAADRAGVDSAFLRRGHRRDAALDREPTHEFASLTGLVDALTD